MKHLWFGAGLLAVLLVISLWMASNLENAHDSPAKDLEKAADAALKEQWPLASALYLRSEKHWLKYRNRSAALAHHDPLSQIDAGFASLDAYVRSEDPAAFAAACAQLARQLRSLHQSHGFHWWNLL